MVVAAGARRDWYSCSITPPSGTTSRSVTIPGATCGYPTIQRFGRSSRRVRFAASFYHCIDGGSRLARDSRAEYLLAVGAPDTARINDQRRMSVNDGIVDLHLVSRDHDQVARSEQIS